MKMLKTPFKSILSAFIRFWYCVSNQPPKCAQIASNEAYPTTLVNSDIQTLDFDKLGQNDAFGVVFESLGNLIIAYISSLILVVYVVFSVIESVGYIGKF